MSFIDQQSQGRSQKSQTPHNSEHRLMRHGWNALICMSGHYLFLPTSSDTRAGPGDATDFSFHVETRARYMLSQRTLSVAAGLILVSTTLASQSATLYKWVDADGTTHYSQRPPAETAEFEKVNSYHAPGNSGEANEAQADASTKDGITQPSQQPEPTSTEATASAPKPASEERCDKARNNLKALNSFARIRIKEDGELRFLTEDEIITRRLEAQALLDDQCN
ncbi:DUF4124 domain-containing protein [Halioxenophilus aromaticivorans]